MWSPRWYLRLSRVVAGTATGCRPRRDNPQSRSGIRPARPAHPIAQVPLGPPKLREVPMAALGSPKPPEVPMAPPGALVFPAPAGLAPGLPKALGFLEADPRASQEPASSP